MNQVNNLNIQREIELVNGTTMHQDEEQLSVHGKNNLKRKISKTV
uniref:Uncharacterized protein n=1 Tax=Rhizophora mucronata TaxID=61149 RepID=A0A2P2QBS2_RHIMU